jgi:microcystin-dependent protein
MSDPYVGEIRVFGFNFPPTGWATCNGQLLSISQNTALFSILGTNYGGNGTSNFGLPNFQGQGAVSQGQARTGTTYQVGETSGAPTVTLLQTEMPSHTHTMNAETGRGVDPETAPIAGGSITTSKPGNAYVPDSSNNVATNSMNPQELGVTGGSQPHNNLMPYLTLNFCIAMQGVFPPRN